MGHSVLVVLTICLAAACSRAPSNRPSSGAAAAGEARSAGSASEWFTEEAHASDLDFLHFNGMSGELYYPEIMAPGVALLDFDNDGDLDVYIVQGQMLGKGKALKDATYPPQGELKDRLFRNDLTINADGTRRLHFTDVTDRSGIDVRTYGMGVAVGDVDNDGYVDIYRTGLDGAVLLHNDGDGTFTDITKRAGVEDRGGWSVSAAFIDYDRDGWLDLYVGNYLIYSVEADKKCLSVTGRRDYCPPNSYRGQPDRLYHNRGDGTFQDVTRTALTGGAYGPALGVSTADFDGDGWLDIYVGNDGEPNQLWINQHDGTFKDVAPVNGAAVNGSGNSEASMGIDAGDIDDDGDEDIVVTNWMSQMNTLYVNDGHGVFEDRKGASGLGPPSLAKTGFGAAWLDYDNDGLLDLLVVNGSVATIEAQARAHDPFPLRMPKQLYRNQGGGRFADVSAQGGRAFASLEVGRGAAFGDIDNDGDTDVVVGNAAGPMQLLVNRIGNRNHWVGLRLVGQRAPRDLVGARVAIIQSNGRTLWRRARADGSYASANDPRVLVGLGGSTAMPCVRVQWPDGTMDEWSSVPIDRYTTLMQGTSR